MTLAAAAVYTASLSLGEIITQSDVAAAAEVSVVSVRDCARRIRPLLIGMADVSPIWAG